MEASAAPLAAAPPGGRARLVSPRLLRLASDERLVAHVRTGSQPAFEVVYDRYHRGILAFCRHMLGSREEAEDAVQHTFMSAYRALVGSDRDIQLRAWLYAIARNRCLSVLRLRRERPSDELGESATEGLADEVQRRADLQEMLADLSALPEDQRAALVLSELGDMSHDEIATVVGCPRDKVKALVFQARSSLQQSREAREVSCHEIREMLSTLSGGALRRTPLRRHVRSCAGCREFEAEVKRQRRAMAAVLPVLPTLGLKESALAAAFGSQGGTAVAAGSAAVAAGAAGGVGAAGGAGAAGGTSALVAKVLVVATVASGGSVAGYQAVSGGPAADAPARSSEEAATTPRPESQGAPAPAADRRAGEPGGQASGSPTGRERRQGAAGRRDRAARAERRRGRDAGRRDAAAGGRRDASRGSRPTQAAGRRSDGRAARPVPQRRAPTRRPVPAAPSKPRPGGGDAAAKPSPRSQPQQPAAQPESQPVKPVTPATGASEPLVEGTRGAVSPPTVP